ncbi:MAG: cytochrome c biogenesis heme-transporting ATPase CcmA [Gammaproteobacteria bacterium]
MTDPDPAILLEGRKLTCIRDDRELFSHLSFALKPSQVLLIEGRNGSGKTSLLRMLSGIRMPDEGDITWNNNDIFKLSTDYRENIAYVGHKDGVKLDLTANENLSFAKNLGNPDPKINNEAALDAVFMTGFEDVLARKLSAGQQRRLALARLLVTKSKLWILDEPFTSLDVDGISVVEKLIKNHLSEEGMLVMSSHHSVSLEEESIVRINLSQ